MSQREEILRDLKRGRRIDPLTALDRYGCFRLAARIRELKDDGHRIVTEIIERGNGVRHASYRMAG